MHENERNRDPLAQAFDAQHRAALVGFDWSDPVGALEKVREETDEVAVLIGGSGVGVGRLAGEEPRSPAERGPGRGVADREPRPPAGIGPGPKVADTEGGSPGTEPGAGAAMKAGGEGESRVVDEVGDLLFAVVNLARLAGVDPVAALSRATAKFEGRFAEVRRLAAERGLPMPGTPLGPLDRLWDEVKGREAGRRSQAGHKSWPDQVGKIDSG